MDRPWPPAGAPSPTSTLVLLVRHGQTPTTGQRLPGRAPGLHLSDAGRDQAAAAADRIAELKRVDAVYASPLERARETAAPIATARGLKVDRPRPARVRLRRLDRRRAEEADEAAGVAHGAAATRAGSASPTARASWRCRTAWSAPSTASWAATRGGVVVCVSHADPIKAPSPTPSAPTSTCSSASSSRRARSPPSPTDGAGRSVLTVNSTGGSLAPPWRRRDPGPRQRSTLHAAPSASPASASFFLQAQGRDGVHTVKCEKQQVAALAEYLQRLLADLPAPGDDDPHPHRAPAAARAPVRARHDRARLRRRHRPLRRRRSRSSSLADEEEPDGPRPGATTACGWSSPAARRRRSAPAPSRSSPPAARRAAGAGTRWTPTATPARG